jgi:hypothetical protein
MKSESPTDPVIEAYKAGIDRTLLRENLKLTPTQRLERLQSMTRFYEEAQQARRRRQSRKAS